MRMLRTPRTSDQFTQISETTQITNFAANTAPYTSFITTNTTAFPRTLAMAALFQQMRVVQVIYTYEPLYNVYQGLATAGSGTSVPDFYWLMDRQGGYTTAISGVTVEALVQGGARPIKFTKNITIKYKPNTLGLTTNSPVPYQSTTPASSGYLNADIQYDKWFATTASQSSDAIQSPVTYYGHVWIVDQYNSPASTGPIGRSSVTLVTQFKQPYFPPA